MNVKEKGKYSVKNRQWRPGKGTNEGEPFSSQGLIRHGPAALQDSLCLPAQGKTSSLHPAVSFPLCNLLLCPRFCKNPDHLSLSSRQLPGRMRAIRGSPGHGVAVFFRTACCSFPRTCSGCVPAPLVVHLFAGFLQAPADGTAALRAGLCRAGSCPAWVGAGRDRPGAVVRKTAGETAAERHRPRVSRPGENT